MTRDVTLLRRFSDPEDSSDPDIAALVGRLRELDYAPAPRPQFRTDLRAQLVAIAPRVVAEGEPAEAPQRARHAASVNSAAAHADAKKLRFGRPLRLVAASVAVLALGLGGAVWKSQSALPGDSLYGLKRTSEDVRLSLTSGDTARGHEYLRLASTRVKEAHDLLGQDSAMASGSGVLAVGISPQTAQLVRSTLSSANSDLTNGSSLLGTDAVRSHSTTPLQIMQSWAPGQLQRLSQLSSEIGAGPLRASAQHSRNLVVTALHRARTLEPQVRKGCDSTGNDKFGPSCTSTSARISPSISTSTHSRGHGKTRATKHATKPGKHNASTSGPTTSRTRSGSGGGSHHPHASPTPTPKPILPTLPPVLPTGKPTLPISAGSCGVGVSVGPIGVSLGSCPKGK